jgi:hypothetical protein
MQCHSHQSLILQVHLLDKKIRCCLRRGIPATRSPVQELDRRQYRANQQELGRPIRLAQKVRPQLLVQTHGAQRVDLVKRVEGLNGRVQHRCKRIAKPGVGNHDIDLGQLLGK